MKKVFLGIENYKYFCFSDNKQLTFGLKPQADLNPIKNYINDYLENLINEFSFTIELKVAYCVKMIFKITCSSKQEILKTAEKMNERRKEN